MLVFVRWMLSVRDINGRVCEKFLYLVPGDGPILVGNIILSQSNLLVSNTLLVLPPGIGNLHTQELIFPTITRGFRTFLHIVPSHRADLKTLLTSSKALVAATQSHWNLENANLE